LTDLVWLWRWAYNEKVVSLTRGRVVISSHLDGWLSVGK